MKINKQKKARKVSSKDVVGKTENTRKIKPAENIRSLTTENSQLEHQNVSLKKKDQELLKKLELYGTILKDPRKLKSLYEILLQRQNQGMRLK